MLLSAEACPTAHDYRRVLLADVNDLLDDEGRPIGEIRASSSVRNSVRSRYEVCSYPGSRRRKAYLINASALDQVTSNWPNVLGVFAYVRRGCISSSKSNPPLIELARISAITLALPAYIIFRKPYYPPALPIPAFVAAAHKMSAGLFGLCKNRLISQVAEGENHLEIVETVGSLYRYAEESGALLSRTGIEACAGPPRLMLEALRVLVEGKCQDRQTIALDIKTLIGQPALFFKYADAVIELTLWLNVFTVCCHEVIEDLYLRLEENVAHNAEYLTRARAALSEYKRQGFSDPSLSALLQLPRDVRIHYAVGAASISRHTDLGRLSSMLRSKGDDALERHIDTAFQSFIESVRLRYPTPDGNAFGRSVLRALVLEREGLLAFLDLQSMIHEALCWAPPSGNEGAAILKSIFGMLPSEYLLQLFGCDLPPLHECFSKGKSDRG